MLICVIISVILMSLMAKSLQSLTLVIKLHPGDVVSNTLDLPARQRWAEHGQVRLPAGAGERRRHVLLLPGRVGDAQDLSRTDIQFGK